MNYGYFDDEHREYVITRPDTPAPWANYLGSPAYGAIISNNAGGYSFVGSGANGRILRYRFNADDRPGRYVYIKDNESGDYWSASWQPVGKDLESYKSVCRHGTAYTAMESEYFGIKTETLYYVPLEKAYEVWRFRVKNASGKKRSLSVTGFAEFTSDSNYEQDGVNLQYSEFITRTEFFDKGFILERINEFEKRRSDGTNGRERFFGLAGAKVDSYDGDLAAFLGPYRGYGNPSGVENRCSCSLNYSRNACGALQTAVELGPGEERTFSFILGAGDEFSAADIISGYADPSRPDAELSQLKEYWHGRLSKLRVKTPDPAFDVMVNTWNAYQCFITFIWSRAASFLYCGLRNGYGYRDTVQDIQGITHLDTELALEKLRFMLSAQVTNGGGLPLVKYDHNAGHEDTPDDESYVKATGHPAYRSDDALWLFPTVEKYIAESGDLGFLNEVIPFANGSSATVYNHLKRAIQFNMERLGDHGLPLGLYSDWNDSLRWGKKGESAFVGFQLYEAMGILGGYASARGDDAYVGYLEGSRRALGRTLSTECWQGDRFIRGFLSDGKAVGAKGDPEASLWLNPQSFAVISGAADPEKAKAAMNSVEKTLNTKYGAMIMYPAFREHVFEGALMAVFNPGCKENAGVFSQTQGWLVLAECLLGEGDRAYRYYRECNPANMNDRAEIRVLEPYIHGQFTEGKDSPFAGRASVHWLTGTASTVMVAAVDGILGLKPSVEGLVVDPCIPSDWDGLSIEKVFRGKKLSITVRNPRKSQKGVRSVTLNGKKLDGMLIPAEALKAENEVLVEMV